MVQVGLGIKYIEKPPKIGNTPQQALKLHNDVPRHVLKYFLLAT